MRNSIFHSAILVLISIFSFASQGFATEMKVVSSILWERDHKWVFFFQGCKPLRGGVSDLSTFRLEFYLSKHVHSSNIGLEIKGPFLYASDYIKIENKECKDTLVNDPGSGLSGYQCTIDFFLDNEIPRGQVSVQAYVHNGSSVMRHPNMYYVLSRPEGYESEYSLNPSLTKGFYSAV